MQPLASKVWPCYIGRTEPVEKAVQERQHDSGDHRRHETEVEEFKRRHGDPHLETVMYHPKISAGHVAQHVVASHVARLGRKAPQSAAKAAQPRPSNSVCSGAAPPGGNKPPAFTHLHLPPLPPPPPLPPSPLPPRSRPPSCRDGADQGESHDA